MANRPFKIPKDTKGNEYFPVTTTDAIIYSDNEEKKVLTEVIKKNLEDLSSLIIDEENRVLKENERKAAEILRAREEDIRKQNEEDRKANEVNRQNSFSSNEAARQKIFNDNESTRQNTFIKAESQRETAETIRQEKELKRQEAEPIRQEAEIIRQEAETIRQEEELKRQEAEIIRQENYDKKVDRTDNAPELTSGFAGNLVGRGEATSEEIGFRPSGGLTSVNDGAARIERLKGNTAVWNQKLDTSGLISWPEAAGNIIINNDGKKVEVTNTAYEGTSGDVIAVYRDGIYNKTVTGHKMLCILDFQSSSTNISGPSIEYGSFTCQLTKLNLNTYYGIYTTTKISSYLLLKVGGTKAIGDTWSFSNIQVHDLTQMFGAGNEPTTIEEFNARKPLGIDEYAYNEGELISTTADELKSVGFNAWDEEWEVGAISSSTGEPNPGNKDRIRSKNFIPIVGGQKYYFGSTRTNIQTFYIEVYQYDSSYRYLGTVPSGIYTGTSIASANFHNPWIFDKEVRFIKFCITNLYGTTYNHDICIHLVHTGYRNGEYEPYEEFRRSLPISEIKDSEGNALFPNGLLSAGEVYDEITATKAIKRIGMVDMGSLAWTDVYATQYNFGYTATAPESMKTENLNYAVSIGYEKYKNPSAEYWKALDKAISNGIRPIGPSWVRYLAVKDSSHDDLPSFKAAMSGVMLYYELAEPIEVDLPEPINLDYEVSDFGTEEVISDTPTTPLKADIIYQFNAVDRIRENSANIKKIEDKLDDISVDLLTPITYSSLKALRDGGSLVKGMWYRITDYVATTKQSETKSANHPFDVIVLATSESELSHLARAIAHEGDTYFNGNDLGAWELWYDLDNDTTKYEWADATNGKGVIYRMIDEKRNDCPYDFKNILFYNDKYTSSTTSDKYYYTFSYVVSGVLYDGTVEKQVTTCYGNNMGMYVSNKKRSLNNNVWRHIAFRESCYYNNFGNDCIYNTFERNCYYNNFGNDCYSNIFRNSCWSNTFGNSCGYNTFGDGCSCNTFGNYCYSNTFGNYCYSNTFGNSCEYNTFGSNCKFNTLGDSCYCCGFYNSSDYDYNGDVREYLGTGTLINDVMNCRFGEGCSRLLIHTTDGVKNLFVSQNLCSLTENEDGYILPEVIEVDEYGDYELKIARNRNGEVKVYCEAEIDQQLGDINSILESIINK